MITLTKDEASALRKAEAALQALGRSGWPPHRPDIITARDALQGAVETFRGLATGDVHPSGVLDPRDWGSDEAAGLALGVAAERMGQCREELGRLLAAGSGEGEGLVAA